MPNFLIVAFLFMLSIAAIAACMALPVMWIVNYVFSDEALVAVFGGPLSFGKALLLNLLCCALFKNTITKE